MAEIKCYIIYISGHVHGVGFRHSARTMARHLGIKGLVKNLPDGRVYIEAEGSSSSLITFLNWCRKGPGYGSVEKVEKKEVLGKGFRTFEVLY